MIILLIHLNRGILPNLVIVHQMSINFITILHSYIIQVLKYILTCWALCTPVETLILLHGIKYFLLLLHYYCTTQLCCCTYWSQTIVWYMQFHEWPSKFKFNSVVWPLMGTWSWMCSCIEKIFYIFVYLKPAF